MYFEETRGRLYECFCDKVSGDGTLLQGAYTLACLEYNKYEGVLDPNRPVRHQEAFITQLQITPNDFTVRTYSMNKRLVQLAHRHIIKLRARHWQNVDEKAKGYLDFLVRPTATEAAPKPKEKRARKSRKGKTAKLADHYDDDVSDEQSPDPSSTAIDPAHQTAPYKTLYYDTERIKACMHDNPLLQALVRYMPGIWSSDSIISIDEEGIYDCFTLIAALDADEDAGMESNVGDYEEDLVDQLTKKLNIEDDRNIVIFSDRLLQLVSERNGD
ncbi:hypothetical protein N0V94_000167 [Neodidymelliopsis sp. IMI 364377]|nr:hypothetical protein N0V94_000167 [Neodidymelliopsis sp. IMI 364377]